jgi:signal peptidase II
MKKFSLAIISILGLFILDRLTKNLLLAKPQLFSGEWVELELFRNPNFYFFTLDRAFLCLVVGAVLVLLLFLFWRSWLKRDYLALVGFLLIIAGGISNFWDRLQLEYVVDWIWVLFLPISFFNIADVMVAGGLICLIFRLIKS